MSALLVASVGFDLGTTSWQIVALVIAGLYFVGDPLAGWVPYLVGGSQAQRRSRFHSGFEKWLRGWPAASMVEAHRRAASRV